MPKYLETKSFVEKFELGTVKNEQFPDVTIESVLGNNSSEFNFLMLMYDLYLEKIKEWAEKNYPEAGIKDHCSFAGLIMYFATGAYGGYGTELYEKERIAERKVHAFYGDTFRTMSAQEVTEKAIEMCIENILK